MSYLASYYSLSFSAFVIGINNKARGQKCHEVFSKGSQLVGKQLPTTIVYKSPQ